MYELGATHILGLFTGIDYVQARDWLLRAAEEGHPQAQCDLGVLMLGKYKDQPSVEDPEAAVKWLRLAADQGVEEAAGHLRELGLLKPLPRKGGKRRKSPPEGRPR
jgi:TPR repeat protein